MPAREEDTPVFRNEGRVLMDDNSSRGIGYAKAGPSLVFAKTQDGR
jgi:hypothetical protein